MKSESLSLVLTNVFGSRMKREKKMYYIHNKKWIWMEIFPYLGCLTCRELKKKNNKKNVWNKHIFVLYNIDITIRANISYWFDYLFHFWWFRVRWNLTTTESVNVGNWIFRCDCDNITKLLHWTFDIQGDSWAMQWIFSPVSTFFISSILLDIIYIEHIAVIAFRS